MDNVAIDAKARTGPPARQHPMLALRISDGPCLYGAGVPYGHGNVFKYRGRWARLAKGNKLTSTKQVWQQWSFGAFGDRLQFVLDREVLVDTQDDELARGAVGARVWSTTLYLDDIRVRKFSLPEPSVTLPPRK